MASAKATVDHDEIRRWVESRGGHPARVKRTGKKSDPGILRIDFPGYSGGDTLEEIDWDEFFEWFDRNKLAFLKQEGRSRFNKLVDRGSVKTSASKKKASSSSKKASSSSKKASSKKSSKSSKKASSSSTKRTPSKKSSKSTKTSAKKTSSKKASSKKTSSKKTASTKTSAKKTSSKKASSKKTSAKKSSGRTSRSAITTTDHDEIRQWVESRGGYPATVIGTESRGEEAGLLRIDYPGFSGAGRLERISWDDFFEKFDEENLAFLYQDTPRSRFSKLVRR